MELAKTESMSLASKVLHISPQGISSSIARLENELGFKLLNRTKKGVCLTEAGQKYLELSSHYLNDLSALKLQTLDNPAAKSFELEGSLAIYSTTPFNIDILPKVTTFLCKMYPNIKLSLREGHTGQVIEAVVTGASEVGLIMLEKESKTNFLGTENHVKFYKLFSNPIYALVSKDSPLASRKSVSIKELLNYPLVIYMDSKNNIVLNHIMANKHIYGEPKVIMDSDNIPTRNKVISEGFAVGFSNRYTLRKSMDENPEEIIAIPISDKLNFYCGYIVNSQSALSAAAKVFINILKANC
ncbi:LysR family transcriptional regulator [Dehalobacter sp. DCM]|nr:LysR family transcriptional regulator [Dehalobacter sp. DCM]